MKRINRFNENIISVENDIKLICQEFLDEGWELKLNERTQIRIYNGVNKGQWAHRYRYVYKLFLNQKTLMILNSVSEEHFSLSVKNNEEKFKTIHFKSTKLSQLSEMAPELYDRFEEMKLHQFEMRINLQKFSVELQFEL